MKMMNLHLLQPSSTKINPETKTMKFLKQQNLQNHHQSQNLEHQSQSQAHHCHHHRRRHHHHKPNPLENRSEQHQSKQGLCKVGNCSESSTTCRNYCRVEPFGRNG